MEMHPKHTHILSSETHPDARRGEIVKPFSVRCPVQIIIQPGNMMKGDPDS
jgi:hypothetical protein